ncbi:MAG: AAA family ATPase [Candidatus Thiodiazotropha sp. (ex Cardiolucina cf. quadrata)]|nr:AAA family ATPase [Candidatus Thiodiazotropha sp. (ex Cardiolucina cf. quadrata)]
MKIDKIIIENFKCYKKNFELYLNEDVNILVGNNEAGKSTIVEAIHLALTGLLNGRYLRNELSQYLFNKDVQDQYIKSLKTDTPEIPPHVLIELYLKDDGSPEAGMLKGNGNSAKENCPGVLYEVAFDEAYKPLYEELVERDEEINTIPIEYYKTSRRSFARKEITSQSIPLKSALIDSSGSKNLNGSDLYISRIIRNNLEDREKVDISQAHRNMKETFMGLPSVQGINKKISDDAHLTDKTIKISVDLATQNAWEASLLTYLDEIPFHYIGKGEQSIVKTALALSHKKSKEANIILIEEPENHLSHTKLNELLHRIILSLEGKQIVVSTHNSFVANKLGLHRLILLHNSNVTKFNDLSSDTEEFFERLPGYDVLRFILCKKAVLVEGDCDELIFQKAYRDKNSGKLPIEDGIDVISVGTSFLRFLEIADKIKKEVIVITDNDGNVSALEKKYQDYLGKKKKDHIHICYESTVHDYTGSIEKYNNNTLEPEMLRANDIKSLSKAIGKKEDEFENDDALLSYMRTNKTKCALEIFKTTNPVQFPIYIKDALDKL